MLRKGKKTKNRDNEGKELDERERKKKDRE